MREKKNSSTRITDFVQSFDKFGDSVNFTVKNGSATYQTWKGIILVLIILYGVEKFTMMTRYEDTTFHSITEKNAIPVDEIITSEDINFNIAVLLFEESLSDYKTYSKEDLHGYVELRFQ